MKLQDKFQDKTPNKLMVVAHPDDESLFGGAQLLQGGWKVVCVTNGDNPIRRAEFASVMDATNSQYEIWDYLDRYHIPLDEVRLEQDLIRILKDPWEKIVTHNEQGEYGHPHHKQIHFLMRKLAKNIWYFNFSKPSLLPDDIWEAKLKLIEFHKSQKRICDDHIGKIRNESVVRGMLY